MIYQIKVLDHGHVGLVDHMGDDFSIVRAARVLPDAEWRGEPDEKLIRYMLQHRHTSPFEHVAFTFDAKAPIFVLRQWMRHRTWRFNEISGRYQELTDEYFVPAIETIGTQAKSNKQGRDLSDAPDQLTWNDLRWYRSSCDEALRRYHDLLSSGWSRELARCVLPLATYSRMMATVDLHNLLHFLGLRLDEHAQYEIRVYAEAILRLIEPIVPVTIAAWQSIKGAAE